MTIDVVNTCPLGSVCEEAKDGKIHRCAWYVGVVGTNGNNEPTTEWRCAMQVMPALLVDSNKVFRSGVAATESFRNEMVRGQTRLISNITNTLGIEHDVKT